jgi:hypothetical protein
VLGVQVPPFALAISVAYARHSMSRGAVRGVRLRPMTLRLGAPTARELLFDPLTAKPQVPYDDEAVLALTYLVQVALMVGLPVGL